MLLAVVLGATGVGVGVEAGAPPASSSTTPPPRPVRISSCGAPYTLVTEHGSTGIDSCAGMLSTKADVLHLRRGETFELEGATQENGTPDFPAPTSADPAVVRRLAVSGRGADGRYQAVGTGTGTLYAESIFCNGGPVVARSSGGVAIRRCPALRVVVSA